MRISTSLGVAMLVCGAILLGVSSGAFDSIVTDRGVDVETADDDDAFVGIGQTQTNLHAADGDFNCTENTSILWTEYCSAGYFSYDSVILTVTDQKPSTELDVVSINGISQSTTNPTIASTTVNSENGEYTVNGVIQCNAVCTGGLFTDDACQSPLGSGEADQLSNRQRATIDFEAAGETMTVDLDRTVTIQCEASSVTEPD